MVFEQDFISRHESSCSVVVQGVKPGENPDLTTMWTALNYPPVSVALPLWVKMQTIHSPNWSKHAKRLRHQAWISEQCLYWIKCMPTIKVWEHNDTLIGNCYTTNRLYAIAYSYWRPCFQNYSATNWAMVSNRENRFQSIKGIIRRAQPLCKYVLPTIV